MIGPKMVKIQFNHDEPVPPQSYRQCGLQKSSFSYAITVRRSYWQSFWRFNRSGKDQK